MALMATTWMKSSFSHSLFFNGLKTPVAMDGFLVFVPAEDGSYVLIGMSKQYKEIFLSVPWGTDRVLKKTRGNIIALGLNVNELPKCWDIDRVEDYERYQEWKQSHRVFCL